MTTINLLIHAHICKSLTSAEQFSLIGIATIFMCYIVQLYSILGKKEKREGIANYLTNAYSFFLLFFCFFFIASKIEIIFFSFS